MQTCGHMELQLSLYDKSPSLAPSPNPASSLRGCLSKGWPERAVDGRRERGKLNHFILSIRPTSYLLDTYLFVGRSRCSAKSYWVTPSKAFPAQGNSIHSRIGSKSWRLMRLFIFNCSIFLRPQLQVHNIWIQHTWCLYFGVCFEMSRLSSIKELQRKNVMSSESDDMIFSLAKL